MGGGHFRLTNPGAAGRALTEGDEISKVLLALHFTTPESVRLLLGGLKAVLRKLEAERPEPPCEP